MIEWMSCPIGAIACPKTRLYAQHSYTLGEADKYRLPAVYGMDESLALQILPDLSIDWVFVAQI